MFYLSLLSEVLRAGRPKRDTKKKEFRKPRGNSKEFFERRYGVAQKRPDSVGENQASLGDRELNDGRSTGGSINMEADGTNVDGLPNRYSISPPRVSSKTTINNPHNPSDQDISNVLEHAASTSKRLAKRLKREAKKDYEVSGAKYNDRVLKVVSSKKIDLTAPPEELTRDLIKTITRRIPSFNDQESLLLLQLLAKKSTGESAIFKFVDRFKRLDERNPRGGKNGAGSFGTRNSFGTRDSFDSSTQNYLQSDRDILDSRNLRGDCYLEIRKLATSAWENVEEWEVRENVDEWR